MGGEDRDMKASKTEGQERVAEHALSKMPNICYTWKEVGAGKKECVLILMMLSISAPVTFTQ